MQNYKENMNNQKIIKDLILGSRESPSPNRLSEIAVELSSWYATLSEEWNDIEVFRAERWLDLREESKSDAQTDKKWLSTDEGKKWIRLKQQLKYIEKTISSIKLRLKILEGESFGRY